MSIPISRRALVALTVVVAAAAAIPSQPAWSDSAPSAASSSHTPDDGTGDRAAELAQFEAMRDAPGTAPVDSRAYFAGFQAGQQLSAFPGPWRELTDVDVQQDDPSVMDPVWSDSGSGWGDVAGRVSALALDGPSTVYAGSASGGVWRSPDRGAHWSPLWDGMPTMAIGALEVNPADHSVWAGTGEANTAGFEFKGDGIYRSGDQGHTWQRVGQQFFGLRTSRIAFDGAGHVYAATSFGVLRRDASDLTSPWTTVLAPVTGPDEDFVSDLRIKPGTQGMTVVAAIVRWGWKPGSQDGYYISTSGGTAGSFSLVNATGDLSNAEIGRSTLSFDSTGSTLYAVVQSSASFTTLAGVFRSDSGDPAGPWTKVADTPKLLASGGQGPGGVQGAYDQYVAVDPADPKHVYLGLEDLYETSDGGATWQVIGPFWNFNLPCWNVDPVKNTCPPTTHTDQHTAVFASDGTVYVGNDGGVYSRPAALRGVVHWDDHNKGLHTLQYYSVGVGKVNGSDAYWGGLQDNGTSLLLPRAKQLRLPAGGDGFGVIVDPANGLRAVNSYTYLTLGSTTNGGVSNGLVASYTTATPSCKNPNTPVSNPCDPNPLFYAPYSADIHAIDHWVAGGRYVWDNQSKGWSTSCTSTACDWVPVHDTGAQTTAVAASGTVTYAAWQYTDSTGYHSGIDTNFGGTWHRLSTPNLPHRYITSISIDPGDAARISVSFGGYTDAWVSGAGKGHVFTSTDGGATFTDATGNLPDLPVNGLTRWTPPVGSITGLPGLAMTIAATDAGVFVQSDLLPGRWWRLGAGLPNSPAEQVVVAPSGRYLVVATYGRGLWTYGPRV